MGAALCANGRSDAQLPGRPQHLGGQGNVEDTHADRVAEDDLVGRVRPGCRPARPSANVGSTLRAPDALPPGSFPRGPCARLEVASEGDAPDSESTNRTGKLSGKRGCRCWSRHWSNTGLGLTCGFGVEPPAGIEPATPSLPSMRGRFPTPLSTSRTHITAQVRGTVETCVVRQREVACSAVSGKSLARAAAWSSAAWTSAPSSRSLTHRRLAPQVQCCPRTISGRE